MDVTSQLNLEREAGMGENTERQPAEPASAGGGSGNGQNQAEEARGPRIPTRGRTSRRLLSPPPGFQPRQPSGPYTRALVLRLRRHQIHVLLLPPEKQNTQKQQTKINRDQTKSDPQTF